MTSILKGSGAVARKHKLPAFWLTGISNYSEHEKHVPSKRQISQLECVCKANTYFKISITLQSELLLTWNGETSCEWISSKPNLTTADWTVVDHFTTSI